MSEEPKRARTTVEWLVANPNLPEGLPRRVSNAFEQWAKFLQADLPEGAEKATALRKMLEAKECAERATQQFT